MKGFKDYRHTLEIDLYKSKEDLWNNIDKKAKWGVNKAKKLSLVVKQCEGRDHLIDFYGCYKETCFHGGINPLHIEEIKDFVLLGCFKDDRLIAGVCLKKGKDKVELVLNGSYKEYLGYQPNNLLYWEMICWAWDEGFLAIDLGGYQPKTKEGDKLDNINKFKEHWGGELKVYTTYSWNLFKVLGRKSVRNNRNLMKLNNWVRGRK